MSKNKVKSGAPSGADEGALVRELQAGESFTDPHGVHENPIPADDTVGEQAAAAAARYKVSPEALAVLSSELDADGPPGTQTVRVRCVENSPRLGVMLYRDKGGEFLAERLTPRQMRDYSLAPGDTLTVLNLSSDDALRDFMAAAEMEPVANEGEAK